MHVSEAACLVPEVLSGQGWDSSPASLAHSQAVRTLAPAISALGDNPTEIHDSFQTLGRPPRPGLPASLSGHPGGDTQHPPQGRTPHPGLLTLPLLSSALDTVALHLPRSPMSGGAGVGSRGVTGRARCTWLQSRALGGTGHLMLL